MARITSQSFSGIRQSLRILRTDKSYTIVHGEKTFIGIVYFMRVSSFIIRIVKQFVKNANFIC